MHKTVRNQSLISRLFPLLLLLSLMVTFIGDRLYIIYNYPPMTGNPLINEKSRKFEYAFLASFKTDLLNQTPILSPPSNAFQIDAKDGIKIATLLFNQSQTSGHYLCYKLSNLTFTNYDSVLAVVYSSTSIDCAIMFVSHIPGISGYGWSFYSTKLQAGWNIISFFLASPIRKNAFFNPQYVDEFRVGVEVKSHSENTNYVGFHSFTLYSEFMSTIEFELLSAQEMTELTVVYINGTMTEYFYSLQDKVINLSVVYLCNPGSVYIVEIVSNYAPKSAIVVEPSSLEEMLREMGIFN